MTTPIEIQASGMSFSALAEGPLDGPLVLCLHGFPQFADAWTKILPILAQEGFRAIAVDQRGYARGARPKDVGDYAIDKLVQDVFHIADALNAKRFHLIGHDWGGIVAWHSAGSAPDRLLSVTSLSTPHPSALGRAMRSDWDQRRRSLYVLLFKMPFHAAERALRFNDWMGLRSLYQGRVTGEALARNLKRLSENGCLTAALNWYRAYAGKAERIKVPSLFIWGSRDIALGRKAAEATRDYVEASYRFEILEGASHWLLEEDSQTIGALVLQHLQS